MRHSNQSLPAYQAACSDLYSPQDFGDNSGGFIFLSNDLVKMANKLLYQKCHKRKKKNTICALMSPLLRNAELQDKLQTQHMFVFFSPPPIWVRCQGFLMSWPPCSSSAFLLLHSPVSSAPCLFQLSPLTPGEAPAWVLYPAIHLSVYWIQRVIIHWCMGSTQEIIIIFFF